MKRTIIPIFFVSLISSTPSFALDSFEIQVCEAQMNQIEKINCYADFLKSDNCIKTNQDDRLSCLRSLAQDQAKSIKHQEIEAPAVTKTDAADTIRRSAILLLREGNNMEHLRQSHDLELIRRCGIKMRENQPKATALREQADALPMKYLTLQTAVIELNLCVSCSRSLAPASCKRASDYLSEYENKK